jgi:lysylphosphatidylglycerol synthetase-like protein (DUF2156 family)
MKCDYHPDRHAVGVCVNCSKPVCSECRTILREKIYCGPCANQLFVPKPAAPTEPVPTVPAHRPAAITAGGVLSIVAGGINVVLGLGITLHRHNGLWLILLVPGAVAILGGLYALDRKHYGWALAGAICALVTIWPFGVLAIILMALSRKKFT